MLNIYDRNQFIKLNEEMGDVANVSNEPKEIVKAWNLSLVGALTNGIVGSAVKGLTKIYKWGRNKWATNNLLSKLNKEYLKALIFFADEKNIDLTTGEIVTVQGEKQKIEVQNEEPSEEKEKKDEGKEYDIDKLLNTIVSTEDFETNKEINDWKKRYAENKDKVVILKSNIEQRKKQIDIVKNKERKDKLIKKLVDTQKELKEEEGDLEQLKSVIDKINKKYRELGGRPEGVEHKEIEKTKLEKSTEKIKKIAYESGFRPTDSFSDPDVFVDFDQFKNNLYKIPEQNKIAIGDQFIYYTKKTGARALVKVTNKSKDSDIVTISFPTVPGFGVNVKNILPSKMPSFDVIPEMEKFFKNFGSNYNNLNSDNKATMIDIYKKYEILKEIKKFLKERGVVSDKKIKKKAVLEKLVLKQKSGKLEGGDLKGNIKLKDILTKKDIEKLKDEKRFIELPVNEINYGKMSNLIKKTEEKGEQGEGKIDNKSIITKYVNKYNLEVIRLLADKYFTSESEKRNWAKKVNRVNAYWTDIIDIDKVNILQNTPFSSNENIKKSTNNEGAIGDNVYNMSVLNEILLGSQIVISKLTDGTNLIISFIYRGETITLPGRYYSSKFDNIGKKLIRITTLINIIEKDGKNTITTDSKKFENIFQKNNGRLNIGNETIPGESKINTYLLFSGKQYVPHNINNPRSAKINIINEIEYNKTGGGKIKDICFFDEKEKKNIRYSTKGTIPKIDVKLTFINELKGDVDDKVIELIKINAATRTINYNEVSNLTNRFIKKQKTI